MTEGATNFSHVFQPLGSIGVRHGCTGQLHNQLFIFGPDGKPEYKFKSGELLRGETDGSSYPNGGLRCKLTRTNCSHYSAISRGVSKFKYMVGVSIILTSIEPADDTNHDQPHNLPALTLSSIRRHQYR